MDRGPLPPKLFFRIGEVATVVGVEPHVLRYWEREFRTIRPSKSAKGQRVYSRRDVETLLRVRELLYGQGFTIAGARKRLRDGGVLEAEEAVAPAPEATSEAVVALQVRPAAAPAAPPAAATPPAASPPARHLSPRVREELKALKLEVETLLADLG